MYDYSLVLENIRDNFRQIPNKEYEVLLKTLNNLWQTIKKLLKITDTGTDEYYIKELLKFYDPKKLLTVKIKLIEELPTSEEIIDDKILTIEYVEKLKNLSIIKMINRFTQNFILLTPEGLVLIFALNNSKNFGEYFRLNTLIIEKYEKFLSQLYREYFFEKINSLQMNNSKIPNISIKEIGILLFFLINGSIGEENAFKKISYELEKAINCVVQSFNKNIKLNEKSRNDKKIVPIRILQRDLSTLQNKISYALYNEKGSYYLKPKGVKYLYKILRENIQNREDNTIQKRWVKILEEYNYWRPILRQNNICFYNHREKEKIEKKIFMIKTIDDFNIKKRLNFNGFYSSTKNN